MLLAVELAGDDSRSFSLAEGMAWLLCCESEGFVRADLPEEGARRLDSEFGFFKDGTFLIFEEGALAGCCLLAPPSVLWCEAVELPEDSSSAVFDKDGSWWCAPAPWGAW